MELDNRQSRIFKENVAGWCFDCQYSFLWFLRFVSSLFIIIYFFKTIVMFLSLEVAASAGTWNFIAIGSYSSEQNGVGMIRSVDGKNWVYNRMLRAEFVFTDVSKQVTLKYAQSGGLNAAPVWIFAGNTENRTVFPPVFSTTIFYSLDDGDTLVAASSGAFGPEYPTSLAFGKSSITNASFWLAVGRTNSTNTSTGIMLFSLDGRDWTPHVSNLTLDQDSSPGRHIEYVNGKWFLAYGLGFFVSTDAVGWGLINTPKLNNGTNPFRYPYNGAPTYFAISPFEEYWAIGGTTLNGSNPVPEFAYSNDFGVTWTFPTKSIAFSPPGFGDQVVHSISFGAGQFVISGGTEFACQQPACRPVANTLLTANGPSTFQGCSFVFVLLL
jgi:hypothetical protein